MSGVQLPRLTALRWWAALAVFACHIAVALGSHAAIWGVLAFGGVGFFFVLSGVVLTWSTPDGMPARAFWRRRFARIYPATFVSGVIGMALVLTGPDPRWTLVAAVAFVLLIQAWWPNPTYPVYAFNGPVWTLSCEAFFYALFPWLARSARRLPQRRLVELVTVFAVVSLVAAGSTSSAMAMHMPALRLSEFAVGVVIGTGLRRGWLPRVRMVPALALYAVLITLGTGLVLQWMLMLPGAAMLICAAAGADLRGEPSWLTARWSVYLGEVSFSFYLMHEIVLTQLVRFGGAGLLLPLGLPLSVAAAVALHHFVELPMQRRLLRTSRRHVILAASEPMPVDAGASS